MKLETCGAILIIAFFLHTHGDHNIYYNTVPVHDDMHIVEQ